jgi:putative metalloprotease
MIKFLPLILMMAYALVSLQFSVWRTKRELDANSIPLQDPELQKITKQLAEALEVPEIKVNIYQIDAVNGLASTDGRIFLTKGFLARKASGEVTGAELASVIAHELGHVALGHMRRRMIDFTGQNTVFTLLSAFASRYLPIIGPWFVRLVSSALMARLSRRDEFEADAWATALLIKAGIGAGPQKSLFRKLDGLVGTKSTAPVWLLSHPKATERIAAIEANEALWHKSLS